jgi:hypothetical protein
MNEKENPYLTMPKDVLQEHLQQFGEAIKKNSEAKGLDLLQSFGSIMSDEDQNKVDSYAILTSDVANLQKAGAIGTLTAVEAEMAESTLQDSISRIKEIDSNFPIDSVVSNSKLNALEKARQLRPLEVAAKYTATAVDTIKKQLPAAGESEIQQFASPPSKGESAMEIINSIKTDAGLAEK